MGLNECDSGWPGGNSEGTPGGAAGGSQRLGCRDVTGLLHLMADLACVRNDSRRWRMEALGGMNRMLPATASAAFVIRAKRDDPEAAPAMVSVFDLGLKGPAEHEAFLNEFNEAPFRDPLSRRALQAALQGERRTVTVTRREQVPDAEWYGSPNVEGYRKTAGVDDCVMSVHRAGGASASGGGSGGGEEGTLLMVVAAFRGWGETERFTVRDRMLIHSLHHGLEWLYRAEETLQRVNRATALSPRLRETLEFLLAGDTERQVAARMKISIHTVHDYVKALYLHFGVSSRGELMARWIQSGEALPAERRGGVTGRFGGAPPGFP